MRFTPMLFYQIEYRSLKGRPDPSMHFGDFSNGGWYPFLRSDKKL